MRRAVLLTILLSACGSEKADRTGIVVPAAPSSSDLALPVTAPMAARERLLNDLDQQNEAARERGRDLDSIFDQNR